LASFRALYIALALVVVFCVSFGIMWRQRPGQELAMPPDSTPIAAQSARPPTPSALPTPAPLEEPMNSGSRPAIAVSRAQPVMGEGLDEVASQPPLPLSIHVWNRVHQHRIEAAVQNLSSTQITVIARVQSAITHGNSEFQLAINPGETQYFGTDSGLEIHSQDHITFQSPPYQDQIEIVP
jgi:hypothetical protein